MRALDTELLGGFGDVAPVAGNGGLDEIMLELLSGVFQFLGRL